jgi:hypothetical protein
MNLPTRLGVAFAVVLWGATAGAQLKLKPQAQPPGLSLGAPVAPVTAASPTAAAPTDPAATEKEAAGKLAAAGWLVLLDRRDWGRSWETASAVFRTSVPLASWMDGIPKVRDPMGVLVERVPAESAYKTTLQGRPDGEYVTSIFMSKFDKRELQEVVTTVREPDGKWRVTGYSTR